MPEHSTDPLSQPMSSVAPSRGLVAARPEDSRPGPPEYNSPPPSQTHDPSCGAKSTHPSQSWAASHSAQTESHPRLAGTNWPEPIGRNQLASTNSPSATIHSPLGGDPKAFSGPQLSSSAARMLTIPPRHPNPFWGPAFRPSGCRDDSLRPQRIRQILNTPGGSRTPNLWIRSPLLYPVELRVPVFSWKTIREGIGLVRGIQSTGSQLFIRRCAGQNTSVPVPPTFGRSHPWALRDTTGNRMCFASGSAHCCT